MPDDQTPGRVHLISNDERKTKPTDRVSSAHCYETALPWLYYSAARKSAAVHLSAEKQRFKPGGRYVKLLCKTQVLPLYKNKRVATSIALLSNCTM